MAFQSLSEVIRRYGEVAERVNYREMNRFIAQIRSRWDPRSHEEEYRFDGWTNEGAFTKCIYTEAFYWCYRPEPIIDQDASDAEQDGQIQIKPSLSEIHDFIEKPLILPPLSEDRRREVLDNITIGMKRQAMASGITDTAILELPKDLEMLLSLVRGINAAGVPSETAHLRLVEDFEGIGGHGTMPDDILRCKGGFGYPNPIAAFRLGSCKEHRARDIYYVLSQWEDRTEITSDAKWQIWDIVNLQDDVYHSLAEWLEHETKAIEKTEGWPMKGVVVTHDRYPVL